MTTETKRPRLLTILCILAAIGTAQLSFKTIQTWQLLGSEFLWSGIWTMTALLIGIVGWWWIWKMQRKGLQIMLGLLVINIAISCISGAIQYEFIAQLINVAFFGFLYWRYWEKMEY